MNIQSEKGSDTRKSRPVITAEDVEKKRLEFLQEIEKYLTRKKP